MTAIEGVGLLITAEFVHTVSTGALVLLLAAWLVYGLLRVERAAAWADGAANWAALGAVHPSLTGWRVRTVGGHAVVRATAAGRTTNVSCADGARFTFAGIADARLVAQLICSSRAD